MSSSAPAAGGSGSEDARIVGANLRVGARLFASAVVFVFAAFVFAFFYLRAVNSHGDFRPAHVNPSSGFGIAILVGVITATASFDLARRRLGNAAGGWGAGLAAALGLGVAVVALQVIQYFTLGFKTAAGGYASVFWGWTLLFLLCWLGALYWMATLLAQSVRGGAIAGGDDAELLRGGADGCVVYLYTLAGIELVSFVLLYLVK
jgi:heme/copper-type cytochrome/quinol oxidase subunit 3